jgi:hypothetical protein
MSKAFRDEICRQLKHAPPNQSWMDDNKKIIGIFFLLLFGVSCLPDKKSKKGFYEYSRRSDLCRIPLIEPLELISAARGVEGTWTYNLIYGGIRNTHNIGFSEKVGIYDSMIIIYSSNAYVYDQMTPAWFVIDRRKKVEKAFIDTAAYARFLKINKMPTVQLHNIATLFWEFEKSQKLPPGWPKP